MFPITAVGFIPAEFALRTDQMLVPAEASVHSCASVRMDTCLLSDTCGNGMYVEAPHGKEFAAERVTLWHLQAFTLPLAALRHCLVLLPSETRCWTYVLHVGALLSPSF
jgi:hypothetical protein